MRRFITLAAVAALTLGITGTALAADDELPHSGRVLVALGGDIDVAAGEQADVVIVINGDARVAGTVNALLVVEGTATVTGGTLESLAVVRGTALVGSGSTVLEDIYQLDSTVDVSTGATITGEVRDMTAGVVAFGIFMGLAALALWVGVGIATVIVGLLIAGLAARQVRSATTLISREPVTTFLVGLLALVLPPLVAVIAIASVLGAPSGFGLLLVVWPLMAFIGYIVAAAWLGEWLLSRREGHVPAERPYGATVLGLGVAFVLGFVPLFTGILSLFGIGAITLAAWRTLRGTGARRTMPQVAPMAAS
jgi:hypothetical protein